MTGKRGRPLGFRLSDAQRATLRNSKLKQRAASLQRRVDALSTVVAPSKVDAASRVLSPGGFVGQKANSLQLLVGDETVVASRRGNTAGDFQAATNRALASHCLAQSQGLAQLCSEQVDAGSIFGIWSTNVYDDATMWVNSSSLRKETYTAAELSLRKKLERSGKIAHAGPHAVRELVRHQGLRR